jgi:hypothetical protein
MRHPAIVGAALDLVSALAAGEGLALAAPPCSECGVRRQRLMTFPHFGQVV